MSDLPDGWVLAPIGSLCTLFNGRAFKPSDWKDKGLPIVRIQNLNNRKASYNYFDKEVDDRFLLNGGELLFAWSGTPGTSFGAHVWHGGKAVLNQHIFRVDFDETLIDKRFFRYAINQKLNELIGVAHGGVGLRHVTKGVFENTEIVVPPFGEQKRIAEKLDSLLARVDSCQTHLERVPQILKRFRQSVLAAATSGRLTEDWRDKRGQSKGNISFDFMDANCFGDYEFPDTWKPQRLKDIADVIGGITKDSKKQNVEDEELPYLRVANVQRGYLDLTEMKTIRVPKQRLESWLLKSGDILFNEGGDIDKLGRGWVWSGEIERCIFQNHVFRARLKDSTFLPKYFSHYGNSRGYDYFLAYGKQTTNLASINKTIIEALPVAVPPPDEQTEIVRRVEKLFVYAERLEARYTSASEHVERLTPSLLAKAFRGELVEQDAGDESAEELVERVRKGREENQMKKLSPRGKKS